MLLLYFSTYVTLKDRDIKN